MAVDKLNLSQLQTESSIWIYIAKVRHL